MSAATIKPVLTAAQLQAFIVSLPKYCATTVFTLAGQTYTTLQVVTLATSVLNASAAITAAKAAYAAAVQAQEKTIAGDGRLVHVAREIVALMFASVPETLSAFAITPPKPRKPLTAEARAAANAKNRATRLARGTSSKKQKAQISGNVTGVTITPVTASGTATGSTATAPVASTATAPPAAGSTVPSATSTATTLPSTVAPVAALTPTAAHS